FRLRAQFVSYARGDFHLTVGSLWRKAGIDGLDLGADLARFPYSRGSLLPVPASRARLSIDAVSSRSGIAIALSMFGCRIFSSHPELLAYALIRSSSSRAAHGFALGDCVEQWGSAHWTTRVMPLFHGGISIADPSNGFTSHMSSPFHVMVVDDDPSMCDFLRTFLSARGYLPVAVPNAEEA